MWRPQPARTRDPCSVPSTGVRLRVLDILLDDRCIGLPCGPERRQEPGSRLLEGVGVVEIGRVAPAPGEGADGAGDSLVVVPDQRADDARCAGPVGQFLDGAAAGVDPPLVGVDENHRERSLAELRVEELLHGVVVPRDGYHVVQSLQGDCRNRAVGALAVVDEDRVTHYQNVEATTA